MYAEAHCADYPSGSARLAEWAQNRRKSLIHLSVRRAPQAGVHGLKLFDRVRNVVTRAIPSKLVRSKLERPLASFTFDDFPKCAWTVAGPILRAYDTRATYYVTGSRCGTFADGTQQYDAQDLRELSAAGHEIACHTYDHQPVPTLESAALRADVAKNAAFLRSIVPSLALESFAYPHGAVDPRTKLLYGGLFQSSRGIQLGINAGLVDLALLRTIPLHSIAERPALLEETLEEASARAGWIVFLTHDVQETPQTYGCTPRTLERTLEALRMARIEVLPVKEACALVSTSSAALSA